MRLLTRFVSLISIILLAGCGTTVPRLHEFWEEADISDPLALRIKQSIYCELRKAVSEQKNQTALDANREVVEAIPDNWGAQMTLTLQVDETGATNPGVSLIKQLSGSDVFTLGLGATASSQATRIDKYYSFFSIEALKPDLSEADTACKRFQNGTEKNLDRHGSSPLFGELGINTWLQNALIQMNAIPSSKFPKSQSTKLDVLSYDVKFIVVTTGTATPSWKLVRLTSSTSPALFSANRTRTQELLLTLGPTETVPGPKGQKTVVPGKAATDLHFTQGLNLN